MADEPTWEDLFGDQPAKPVIPTPVQPAPHAPVQPTPPGPPWAGYSQQPPVQPSPYGAPAGFPPPVQQPFVGQPFTPPPADPDGSNAQFLGSQFGSPDGSRRALRDQEYGRQGNGGRGSSRGNSQPPKRGPRLVWLWVLIVIVLLGGGGFALVWSAYGQDIRNVLHLNPPIDYSGSGDGQKTTITILPGQIGNDIAKTLTTAGVTKTQAAFYDLLLKQKKAPDFEPGTFRLEKQMSAKSALAALLNPANRVIDKVVVPEGFTLTQILARASKETGVPLAQLQAAAKNYTSFGVPSAAPSLEGFLFPATYDFNPGVTAQQILQAMVDRMNVSLKSHGVAPANELSVLTLASIIQKEGGTTPDFYKVSRVFTNRLAKGMHLQSDATVSYGAGSKTIETTGAQRADASNKYNTYVYAGLPIGPISSPGDTAIDAALHPVAGPWLYFVLVNGDTGETVYSTTIAGQNAAVKQWQAWLQAHPGYGQ